MIGATDLGIDRRPVLAAMRRRLLHTAALAIAGLVLAAPWLIYLAHTTPLAGLTAIAIELITVVGFVALTANRLLDRNHS